MLVGGPLESVRRSPGAPPRRGSVGCSPVHSVLQPGTGPRSTEPTREGEPVASVMWFRRDLRLGDNPALLEAAADGPVLPLFVLDPALWGPAGPSRRAYLAASLRALDAPVAVVAGGPGRPGLLGPPVGGGRRGRRAPGLR